MRRPTIPTPVYADGMSIGWCRQRDYAKQAKADATKILDRAAPKAAAAGVECATMTRSPMRRGKRILAVREEGEGAMRSSWRRTAAAALPRLLLGSETTKVLTHSKLPVLVVR